MSLIIDTSPRHIRMRESCNIEKNENNICYICFKHFKSTRMCKLHFWDCFQSHFVISRSSTTADLLDNMCIHCGFTNRSAVALGRHLESQHNHDNYSSCYICGKRPFKSELEMKSHLEMHDLMLKFNMTCKLFYCTGCEKTFDSKAPLQEHLYHAHSRCTVTNIEFSQCGSTDDNIRTMEEEKDNAQAGDYGTVINIEKKFNSKCTQTDIFGVYMDDDITAENLIIVEEVHDLAVDNVIDLENNCGPECTEKYIGSSECRSPNSGVLANGDDMTTAEDFVVEEVRYLDNIVINVGNVGKNLWKCPICPNFVCTYGLKQRSHNLNMHKDCFKSFCRFCGFLKNSQGRLRAHEARCQFHLALKRDPSGVEYVTMWRRTAKDIVRKTSMLKECHSSMTDIFLLSKKSKKALLNYVPFVTKRYTV